MSYKVKEVADMVGISVRTLHHYDQIGLLKPASISAVGYRLYTDQDLERLQQILFFRELDFSLQEIRDIVDSPGFDRQYALQAHKELLIEKKKRLAGIIQSIDQTINSIKEGIEMANKDRFEPFDMKQIEKHKEKYAEEVRQKYDKKVVDEAEQRTSKYTENDWKEIMFQWDTIYKKLAATMDKGPEDPQVQEAVEELRTHITDHFYTCTPEIFRGLGDLYVDDERFSANIDKYRPGLAVFLREAMHIYCDNLGKEH